MKDSRPLIFRAKDVRKISPEAKRIDAFHGALRELFRIDNPRLSNFAAKRSHQFKQFADQHKNLGVWIYYPWCNKVVHCLPEELYFKVRTARNRNIITLEEQQKYRETKIGIAGLSVGSAILSALVVSGGPKVIKIADYDVIEVSNLNRIAAKLTDVGLNKAMVAARQVWELDPFADLRVWERGLNRRNLEDFIVGEPALKIFVDEMDNLGLKIFARQICKRRRIPVLMGTDNGDAVILDVERFDLEPRRPIFHGSLKNIPLSKLRDIGFKKWLQLSTKIIGPEYMTERLQQSMLEIGKTIPAVPQLGPTASIAGAAVAFAVRKIASGREMPSGRYVISLEEKLIEDYRRLKQKKMRTSNTRKFVREFMET